MNTHEAFAQQLYSQNEQILFIYTSCSPSLLSHTQLIITHRYQTCPESLPGKLTQLYQDHQHCWRAQTLQR